LSSQPAASASGGPSSSPLPRQVPLSEAAKAPKGRSEKHWARVLNLGVMILFPLLVPDLALFLVRGALSLLDLSFSLVAVAVATLTRATITRTTNWLATSVFSFVFSIILVVIGVATDPYLQTSELLGIARGQDASYIVDHAARVATLGAEILQSSPTFPQWFFVIVLGLLIVSPPFVLILTEEGGVVGLSP